MRYSVTVSNVGTVHTGNNRRAAETVAREYADNVAAGEGRGDFPVVVFKDGEPLVEYIGATVALCGILSDGEGWSVNDVYRSRDIAIPADATIRQILKAVRAALGLWRWDRLTPWIDGEGWRIAGSTYAVTICYDY